MHRGLANSWQKTVLLSDIGRQRAMISSLPDQLDASEDRLHQLRSQFCVVRNALAFKEIKFSALAGDYYPSNNSRRGRDIDIEEERETERGCALTVVERSLFIDLDMTRVRTIVLRHYSIVVAVVYGNF